MITQIERNVPSSNSRSLGVPENSAFMDVEKILKIVHVKNKFWKNSEESDFKNYVF